jgi:hypothetical protein
MEETQLDGTSTEIKDPKAVLDALDRAKKDAKQFRLEKEELEKQLSLATQTSSAVKSKLLNQMITQHLAGLGIQNSDRLMKYIKAESLILTDDFELEGLDEQINSIKADFPELFDPKLLVGGKADSAHSTPVKQPMTASQKQALLVLGK